MQPPLKKEGGHEHGTKTKGKKKKAKYKNARCICHVSGEIGTLKYLDIDIYIQKREEKYDKKQ